MSYPLSEDVITKLAELFIANVVTLEEQIGREVTILELLSAANIAGRKAPRTQPTHKAVEA